MRRAGASHSQRETGIAVAGLLVRRDDGTEIEINPGDAYSIDPGHDAKVIDDEPWVGVDFSSVMATDFAKAK